MQRTALKRGVLGSNLIIRKRINPELPVRICTGKPTKGVREKQYTTAEFAASRLRVCLDFIILAYCVQVPDAGGKTSCSHDTCPSELERARRKPLLLFVLVGVLLFRLATRQFVALLFQLPPRRTRLEPSLSQMFPLSFIQLKRVSHTGGGCRPFSQMPMRTASVQNTSVHPSLPRSMPYPTPLSAS